jgi:hypothetical protein
VTTDEDRRSFENLMLLCYRHHKETDDVGEHTTEILQAMKLSQETRHGNKPFKVNEAFLYRIEAEMQTYWEDIAYANEHDHVAPDFAVKISTETSPIRQFAGLTKSVERVQELLAYFADCDAGIDEEIRKHLTALGYDLTAYNAISYYRNPFSRRNWEMHMLASRNALTDLVVELKTTEVRFLEEYIKTHPNESDALAELDQAKKDLHCMAVSTGYAD